MKWILQLFIPWVFRIMVLKLMHFNDPLQALSDFKSGTYDFVLIDYKMPKIDNINSVIKIRKINDRVKICFITAFDVSEEELKQNSHSSSSANYQNKEGKEDSEVECFIQKPIDIDELAKP